MHASLSTHFLGGETGDAYEMARHIWWYKTALQTGTDIFEHSLLGYPEGLPAAQLWANPLQFFPTWLFAFMMPLPVAYNIFILITLLLNGWCMYILARRRLGTVHHFPAFIAGLIFMIFPIMQGHLFDGHLGLLVQWTLPLFLIALFDFADLGESRRFMIAVGLFLLAAMGHTLQIIYALAPLSALFLLARLHRRDFVGAMRLLAVALTGCLLLLLFLSPIIGVTLNTPRYSETGGYVRYSIDLLGIVSPSFANPFWRDIATHSAQVLGTNLGESASYIGVLGGFLALLGFLFRRESRWWLLVALLAWLLALGPVLKIYDRAVIVTIAGYDAVVPLPYALFINLPLFELARTPGRFMFLFAAMFALVAGFGMAVFWSSQLIQNRHRYLQAILALLLVFFLIEDYKLFDQFPSVPAAIPDAIHDLRRRRDIRAVYNVPHDNLLAAKEAMYLQTAHGKPLIAGHDTRATTVDPARLEILAHFRPYLLTDAGADIVILNKTRAQESGPANLLQDARLWLGEPLYEDERLALFETPQVPHAIPKLESSKVDGQSHVTYIYKEQPGWLEFNASLNAVNRRVNLSLNDTPLGSLLVDGALSTSIPLPIARRGYNTFRITLDPPCPERVNTAFLLCQRVTVEDVEVRVLSSGAIYDPIRIADGIVLAGFFMPQDVTEELSIRFWWRFETDRSANDVRFIHVLNEKGISQESMQDDYSHGELAAGSELTETVTLSTDGLEPGEYRVLTGWYALPDLIRYDVLTDIEGAQDDTIVLGTIRVRD